MRLIDANALYRMHVPVIEGDAVHYEWVVFVEDINEQPTIDAVPVVMIESRINGLKKMLIDIDSDDVDNIWALRTEIDTLTELLEMWTERKE